MTIETPKRGYIKLNRSNRNIRLNDEEWEFFRENLGVKWLREQIAIAIAKQAKKIKSQTDQGITP